MMAYNECLKQAFELKGKDILLDAEKCKSILLDIAPQYKSETELLYIVLHYGVGSKILGLESKKQTVKQREIKKIESWLVSNPQTQLSQKNAEVILSYICSALGWTDTENITAPNISIEEKETSFSGFTDSLNINIKAIPDNQAGSVPQLLTQKDILEQREKKAKRQAIITIIYTLCFLALPVFLDVKFFLDSINGLLKIKGSDNLILYVPVMLAFPTLPVLIARIFYNEDNEAKRDSFSLVFMISFISSFLYILGPIASLCKNATGVFKKMYDAWGVISFFEALILSVILWGINVGVMYLLTRGTDVRNK